LPAHLIDAVFIDEAHHEPARTWAAINDYYLNQKRVFFTATPFRRDRKRLRAKLVYHYPLDRAIDDGILRPINFIGEHAGLHDDDVALLQTAIEVFAVEKESNPDAAILIRTDSIDHAKILVEMYRENNMNVHAIHSKRSQNVNARLIEEARIGELDGLVCVGIASEGLDIPNLKVAVLHAAPRSIPYTIQFLGRISRQPSGQVGPATLVANTDEVRGQVSRLYKSDRAWSRLIPDIVDEHMRIARYYRSSMASISDFQMPELNVFFSALVYESVGEFCYNESFQISRDTRFEIVHIEQENENAPLIVVTRYDKPLDWASRTLYVEDVLDVHILYYVRTSGLFFELTTNEIALGSFKKGLISTDLHPISHGRLYRTLSEFNQDDYIMVGMRNAAMRGASQPSYKTVMGKGVQASVRASEGRVFSIGHALLRLNEKNAWGLATRRGRVWAMKRGNAEEFRTWCDNLSEIIEGGPMMASLPGLSFLASTSPVNRIDSLPIAVVPDDLLFRASSTIIHVEGEEPVRNVIPIIEPVSIVGDTGALNCRLTINDYQCGLVMDFHENELWLLQSQKAIKVRAERSETDVIDTSLAQVFAERPPSLIMPDGSVIEGRNRITPNRSIESLPDAIWKAKDWTGCDITAEKYVAEVLRGRLPVINKTIEFIEPECDRDCDVVILDDGVHEIADLIWFQNSKKTVHFVHCKASSGPKAGCRKADCDVLYAQAMRSLHWVSSTTLIDRLQHRLHGSSRIVLGSQDTFENLRDTYRINDWRYEITLVQPGFNISQVSNAVRRNNNVYELTIPMYERILGCLASLQIWGT
jgi:hypothetical protein